MKLELKNGAVKLGPNQTLKVVDGAGSTVTAVEGSVWITEENQPRDIQWPNHCCTSMGHCSSAMLLPWKACSKASPNAAPDWSAANNWKASRSTRR